MVSVTDILRHAPLIAAAAWFLLAILQAYRDRWHTWTETFFLAACFFAGSYALSDWFFFNATLFSVANPDAAAYVAALASLTSLILAALFVLLFTLVYLDRMKRWYWTFVGIATAMTFIGLTSVIDHVKPPANEQTLYVAVFHPLPFAIFLLYLLIYASVAIWNLYRLYEIVKKSSRNLARRAAGLLLTFTLTLVLGLLTNGYLGVIGNNEFPPPFSTLLGLVAGNAYYTLYPAGRQRIAVALRQFQSRRYSIKAAFLTFGDGTLIGSKVRPGEKVVDEDLFGATLDVIQNFMRTSFPILRGKSLTAITHGSYTLVMERARYAYITVVLEGHESDQLRRQMRDLLLGFEAENRQVLARWQGVPSDAKGTEQMLTEFFVESPLV